EPGDAARREDPGRRTLGVLASPQEVEFDNFERYPEGLAVLGVWNAPGAADDVELIPAHGKHVGLTLPGEQGQQHVIPHVRGRFDVERVEERFDLARL